MSRKFRATVEAANSAAKLKKNYLFLSVFNVFGVPHIRPRILEPVLHFPRDEDLSKFIYGLYSVPHEGMKRNDGFGFFAINNSFVLPRELRNVHMYEKKSLLYEFIHNHSVSYDGFFPIYENRKILYENLGAAAAATSMGENGVRANLDNQTFCKFVRELNGDFYTHGEPTVARKHLP